jgi:putative transposase
MKTANHKITLQIKETVSKENGKSLKVSSLLQKINFSISKTTKFNISIILRLYLFKRIKGLNQYTRLQKYLNENEAEALELGIIKDENGALMIPPKRTFNNYITQHDKKGLDELVELILSEAVRNNVLLDLELVKKTIVKNSRAIKKEFEDATRLVKRLVSPKIEIPIHHNAKYSTADLLDVLTHVATTHDFTNNGSTTFEDMYPNTKTPSSDTMLHHFSKFESIEQVMKMSDGVLDLILRFLKQNYNVFQNRKVDIAFDEHDIEFYGKSVSHVVSGKAKNGTSRFFRFLTCSIVVAGKRFIIDIQPVNQLSRLEDLFEKSLLKVKSRMRINMAYLDRGFDKIKIINVLKKHKVNFLMPKVRSPTVKAWFEKSEGARAYVVEDFQIGKKEHSTSVNLVLVDDEEGVKRAFICNFPVAEPMAHRLYSMYSKRWGIETGYRNLDHDFKPRTTSKNYLIRLFYFVFSCFLYNLWVLVNICISFKRNGVVCEKPIITAKRFAIILYQVRMDFDNGG